MTTMATPHKYDPQVPQSDRQGHLEYKEGEGSKTSKENNPAEALSSGVLSLDALPVTD